MRISAALRSERGQALVEFALVAPVLLLLLLGIVQFGIAYNDKLTLTDAVRAGARAAVVAGPDGAQTAAVEAAQESAPGLALGDGDVQVTVNGSDVTVTASYPYSIDILGLVVKDGQLTSSTTEKFE